MGGGDPVFAFDNLDFSDAVLHIEIVSRKDFLFLKSLVKRIPCNEFIHAVVQDLETSTTSVRVRTLNVSSRILSSESLYFYKEFKNDGKESRKRELTLKINASDEAPLIDLLNFMYINNLSATTPHQLETVRMIAEKLEATSCVKYVHNLSKAFRHEFYSGESSCANLMEEAVEPLKDAAKNYLLGRHKDLIKSKEEAMCLPLSALEIVLGTPGIRVESEYSLYQFIVKWARLHYPGFKDSEELYAVWSRLLRFIYFPYISFNTIGSISFYPIMGAMHFNDGPQKIERVYQYHPTKVVHCNESALPRSVVYFSLTKQDLANLSRSKKQLTESFMPGYRCSVNLFVMARCNKPKQSSDEHFGLFIVCGSKFTGEACIDYEFAVLNKKPLSRSREYRIMSKADSCTISRGSLVGEVNPFGVSWDDFMDDHNDHFIDDTLHLRVETTLTSPIV